jgi:WD40 repeat protein
MTQDALAADYGPNIGTEDENFFQSDRDIKLSVERRFKQKTFAQAGDPVELKSKALHFQLVISGTERIAFTAMSAHHALKVDLDTKEILQVYKGHKGPVTHLLSYVKESRRYLLTASWDKTIKKWCAETGDCLMTFSGHADFVKSIIVSGCKLYSASTDKLIAEWDLDTGKLLRSFGGHRRSVEDISISPDGAFIYSASSDNTIRKWDIVSGDELGSFEGHLTSIRRLLMVDEDSMWSVSADKTACRWDLEVFGTDTDRKAGYETRTPRLRCLYRSRSRSDCHRVQR